MNALPFSAAADRNRHPILAALQALLPSDARVVEVAAGTGQHAAHMATQQPGWRWWPTDADAALLPAIDARCRGLSNVAPAARLDLLAPVADRPVPPWPDHLPCQAVYSANLLHISPWATCPALMAAAADWLAPGGLLVLYGPYRVAGVPTAPSNEAFDASLRERDPQWGLRALEAVQAEAVRAGLAPRQVLPMPANNLLVVLAR